MTLCCAGVNSSKVLDNNLIVQFLVYTLAQLLMAEFLSFLETTIKCGL